MRIHIRTIWDIETGRVISDDWFDYSGPIALCDRSTASQANAAANTASGAASNLGSAGMGVEANLVPRLEQNAVNPPGFGTIGLGQMEDQAMQSGAAASGAAAEKARLNAIRTGNAAGLGSTIAAGAGSAARETGGALQSILAKNAELKASQMSEANKGLEGIMGEDIRGQAEEAGLVPKDIEQKLAAEKTDPWAGDMAQLNDILGIGGRVASGILGGLGGGGVTGGLKGFVNG